MPEIGLSALLGKGAEKGAGKLLGKVFGKDLDKVGEKAVEEAGKALKDSGVAKDAARDSLALADRAIKAADHDVTHGAEHAATQVRGAANLLEEAGWARRPLMPASRQSRRGTRDCSPRQLFRFWLLLGIGWLGGSVFGLWTVFDGVPASGLFLAIMLFMVTVSIVLGGMALADLRSPRTVKGRVTGACASPLAVFNARVRKPWCVPLLRRRPGALCGCRDGWRGLGATKRHRALTFRVRRRERFSASADSREVTGDAR